MRIALPLSRFVAEASAIAPALAVVSGYAACSLVYGTIGLARRMAGPLLALSMALSPSPAHAGADPAIPADWATASAPVPFTHADTLRQTLLTVMFVADTGQTIDGLSRVREGYHETNPLLQNRSPNAVRAYFTGAAVGSYLIARSLSPEHRKLFQYAVIGVEALCIIRNHRLGLHYTKQF